MRPLEQTIVKIKPFINLVIQLAKRNLMNVDSLPSLIQLYLRNPSYKSLFIISQE